MWQHVHMIHLRNLGLTMNLMASATAKEMPAQMSTRAYGGKAMIKLSTALFEIRVYNLKKQPTAGCIVEDRH